MIQIGTKSPAIKLRTKKSKFCTIFVIVACCGAFSVMATIRNFEFAFTTAATKEVFQLWAQPKPRNDKDGIEIDLVWSGHEVNFDFLTDDGSQYVTYYNANRTMTVAKRTVGDIHWQITTLDSTIGWDSHNYVTLAIDKLGYIHISGNMHASPLVYFRSTTPNSIDNFESIETMVTKHLEKWVTYPKFFNDRNGDLIFQYRHGGSGNGITLWNHYNVGTQQWSRPSMLNQSFVALFDGQKEANAYHNQPILGPDGFFYIVWMWRDTPFAATNHNLSIMKSPDLLHWSSMDGEPITLPVVQSTPGVAIDPVGPGKGLINIGFGISFDSKNHPVVTYHKYGPDGSDQIYNARWESHRWAVYQTSKWKNYTYDLNQTGTLDFRIMASPVKIHSMGHLYQCWEHNKHGIGRWILNETTLEIIQETNNLPAKVRKSNFPGMKARTLTDGEWSLHWESLPVNQDLPLETPWPEPVMLTLHHETQGDSCD
jgi:hypothetical protein